MPLITVITFIAVRCATPPSLNPLNCTVSAHLEDGMQDMHVVRLEGTGDIVIRDPRSGDDSSSIQLRRYRFAHTIPAEPDIAVGHHSIYRS